MCLKGSEKICQRKKIRFSKGASILQEESVSSRYNLGEALAKVNGEQMHSTDLDPSFFCQLHQLLFLVLPLPNTEFWVKAADLRR